MPGQERSVGYSPKLPLGRQRLAPGAAVWARLSPIEQLPSDPPHHGAQGGTPRPAAGALPLRAPLRAAPLRAAPLRSAPGRSWPRRCAPPPPPPEGGRGKRAGPPPPRRPLRVAPCRTASCLGPGGFPFPRGINAYSHTRKARP